MKENLNTNKMKKKLLGIALLMCATIAMSSNAQVIVSETEAVAGTVQVDNAKNDKLARKAKAGKGDFKGRKGNKPGKGDFKSRDGRCTLGSCAFQGLDLTAEQQKKVEALNSEESTKMKALREECKKDMKQAKDSLRCLRNKERTELRREYLKNLQGILSPAQYLKFLENNYINVPAGQMPRANAQFRINKDAKHMYGGKHLAKERAKYAKKIDKKSELKRK